MNEKKYQMGKTHNATDVIQEIDDLIDHIPGKEHYYVTIDDLDPPLRIEIHKGMTYREFREACQAAYMERQKHTLKKILLPK